MLFHHLENQADRTLQVLHHTCASRLGIALSDGCEDRLMLSKDLRGNVGNHQLQAEPLAHQVTEQLNRVLENGVMGCRRDRQMECHVSIESGSPARPPFVRAT